jgi:hypothetical protein
MILYCKNHTGFDYIHIVCIFDGEWEGFFTNSRCAQTFMSDSPKILTPINFRINNFESELPIDQFLIKKITDRQREVLLGVTETKKNEHGLLVSLKTSKFPDFHKMDDVDWNGSDFIIESINEDYYKENIDTLLFAFRLYKSGTIYLRYSYLENEINDNEFRTTHFIYPETTKGKLIVYTINNSEIHNVKNIYASLNILKREKSDQFIMLQERFNNAISRITNPKNAFIDFISILEGIFIRNEKDELRFRFSLIVSFLLNNRLNIPASFNKIREFYDIRSSLSHGSTSKHYTEEKLIELYDYTRELIKWYLSNFRDEYVFQLILNKLEIP